MNMNEEIEVPDKFVKFATVWHDGQWSALYGVASTGKTKLGEMFQLYTEIEPTPIYDLIGTGGVEYEDFAVANQFVVWCDNFLTDEWWEERDKEFS